VSAYGSATVRAYGSATVSASGSATVRASKFNAVHKLDERVKVTGTEHVIEPPDLTVAQNWLDYYGLEPDEHGVVTLYKSVQGNWLSPHEARGPGLARDERVRRWPSLLTPSSHGPGLLRWS
jgi:hypothetical protein